MTKTNPICVALDTPELPRALTLAKELHGHVGMMKLGMEFFMPMEYKVMTRLLQRECRFFWI